MFFKFLIFLYLSIVNTSAFPGESFIRGLKMNFANFCFGMNKCELVQHALMDHFYVQFLMAETNAEANVKITQIVIYTHIFMLRWKIDQNRQLIEKLRTEKVLLEVPGIYSKAETRSFTRMELIDILMNSPVQFVNGSILPLYSVLCILLVLKNEIFAELGLRLPSPTDELPRCEDDNVAEHFIEVNHDQIMEWLLADLLHFLPKRPWFFKKMRQIKESKDIDKIMELRWKFYKVFGFAKTSILSESYFPELDILIPDPDKNLYFELAYRAFFRSTTVESKWRNKIVLDKILYDEWVVKFFKQLYAKITQRKKSPITDIWLEDLRSYWRLISQQFWLNGNYLKKQLENLTEKSRETPIRMKDLFENNDGKDKPMLLLENGPDDISLFHALAICTEQYTAIYMKKWQKFTSNVENLVEYSLAMQEKLVKCVAKNLRKPYNGKEDEYLAKSHLEKIVKLLKEQEIEEQVDGDSSEFSHLLIEHKHLWNEILDPKGIEQIDKLLNENYLSAREELSNSENENEDHFTDTEGGGGSENSKVEISHKIPEIDESKKKTEKNDAKRELTLEQVKMRKKLLKEMRNKKAKVIGNNEWKGKQKKFESHKSPLNHLKNEEASIDETKIEKIRTKIGKSTADSSPKNRIHNKNDNKCKNLLKEMDIQNMADLSDDTFLGLLYLNYMDGQFGDECVEYLHISVLVRAIGIKMDEFDRKDELTGKFAYQWMELISTEFDQLEDDAKFLMDKLYFVYNELCLLQQSYCSPTIEKAIKMLGDRKLTKIGKKSEKIDNDNDNNPEQMRLTQFGSYKIATLKALLAQLHLFTFAMMKAKNEEFGENGANLNFQNERLIGSLFGERNLDENKLNEMVEKMRNLIKEQQIDELKLMEMFEVGEPIN